MNRTKFVELLNRSQISKSDLCQLCVYLSPLIAANRISLVPNIKQINGRSIIHIRGDPIEAAFFAMLLKTMNAKKVIEVRVFTGYTTLVMEEALPKDGGSVIALYIYDDYASVGKPMLSARKLWYCTTQRCAKKQYRKCNSAVTIS